MRHVTSYDDAPRDCLILDWLCVLLFPPLGDRPGGDAGVWARGCFGAAEPCLGRGCAGAGCGAAG